MINATIIASPMEIGMDRGPSIGAPKSHSDGPEFGAVLDSKIKQQDSMHDAKPTADDKPIEHSDPKPETKAEAKPEVESKSADKAKADNDSQSSAQSDPKPADDQAAQKAAEQVAAQAAAIQAANQAAAVAKPVEVSADTQAQFVELLAETEGTQSAAQTQQAVPAQTATVNSTVQDANIEMMSASAAEAQKATDGKNELPITDAKVDENVGKQAKTPANARSTFFGLASNQQVTPETQAKATSANAGLDGLYNSQLQGQSREHSSDKPALAVAKEATSAVIPEALLASAQPKPAEPMAKDLTTSTQVAAALRAGIDAQSLTIGSTTGSDNARSEGSDTGSQSQTNGQEAVFGVPAKTSFESVIRGMDATTQVQAPQSPDTDMHTKIIDQVIREIKLHQVQGQSDLTVKLNPAELGEIKLHITQTASGMTSQIQASSDQVKGLLQAHLPTLMGAMSDAGLKMDSVTVTSQASFNSLMQDTASGTAYQQPNKQRHGRSGNTQDMGVDPALINAATGGLPVGGSVGYSWLA